MLSNDPTPRMAGVAYIETVPTISRYTRRACSRTAVCAWLRLWYVCGNNAVFSALEKDRHTSLGNPTKLALPPQGAVFHALGDRMPDKGIFREVAGHMVQHPQDICGKKIKTRGKGFYGAVSGAGTT